MVDDETQQPRDRRVTDGEGDRGRDEELRTARVETLTGRFECVRQAEQPGCDDRGDGEEERIAGRGFAGESEEEAGADRAARPRDSRDQASAWAEPMMMPSLARRSSTGRTFRP